MGAAWAGHPSWQLVTELSDATGTDLARLLTGATADELRSTAKAQLATYTLSTLVLDAVRRALSPDGAPAQLGPAKLVAAAGHSLGEYTALVASGVLSPAEGALLVQARGRAMQAAADAHPGTMAAVLGLSLEEVAASCEEAEAWVANDNAPGQVVVAGTVTGVEEAGRTALGRGAKRVISLQVGGAFHSPLMAAAQQDLDAAVSAANFRTGVCPVVANVDAEPHTDGFAPLLSAQLCSRVRWRESLTALEELGGHTFLELGPGTELSGMVRRTLPEAARANVATPDDIPLLEKALHDLAN